jgi:hypothetical protein
MREIQILSALSVKPHFLSRALFLPLLRRSIALARWRQRLSALSEWVFLPAQRQLGDVGGDATTLVAGEQLGRRAASRLILAIDLSTPVY